MNGAGDRLERSRERAVRARARLVGARERLDEALARGQRADQRLREIQAELARRWIDAPPPAGDGARAEGRPGP
ncbi:hypothetical protein [Nonomuraea gerenzanensis]|uniref:Uncharacterized protein n=1 Tax=Nonomuraea gerenzanensis TaxID=93944 RepID=A0A1M4EC04_9ACTN|nr:hypothetical protein [Nonomuraea gerenzanensis]UBU18438.1 hypothetical protein LCN96_26475 [Nonomuraea gerenzanensis]SBO96272.1 hypothetical protein BN4615_P5788 [Nonomuraea gerenzanensis]